MKYLITLLWLSMFIPAASAASPSRIPALNHRALIIDDADGIPHILARDEHDLLVMQGWVHARDRLFQMDVLRRRGSGTLAELLGPGAIPSDVESRTVGIYRAAAASLPLISAEARAGLAAYAAGVNAYVESHLLPPEYGVLEITRFEPWTPLDSLTVGRVLIFSLNFDLEDIERTEALLSYQAVFGDERGRVLFFADLFRSAPLLPASTIPDASAAPAPAAGAGSGDDAKERRERPRMGAQAPHPKIRELGRRYLERIREHPLLRRALTREREGRGSNEWAVSAALTENGRILYANDEHLELGAPALWYENHLRAPRAGFDVTGSSLPGLPYVVLGHNRHTAWGATIHFMDMTDVYQEQVVPDPSSPSGLSSVFRGRFEHVIPMPQRYFFNRLGDEIANNLAQFETNEEGPVPPVVLIIPRRNNGPIVELDTDSGFSLSVQFTGFSGSRELDSLRAWNLGRDLDDFIHGLENFDNVSLNWAYADVDGNIAYFVSGEMPIREDLQASTVTGAPPILIRNGQGGNEWIPRSDLPADQAIPFEILPFAEMPQIVNPPAGWFVNGNNDPAGLNLDNDPFDQLRPGGGIYYLSGRYNLGARAARVTELLKARLDDGPLSLEDMKQIQADVVMLDARLFTPYIVQAFRNASRAGASPRLTQAAGEPGVAEAVQRLSKWDFSTPTGIPQGFDAWDVDGVRGDDVSDAEAASSIAATLYSMWRGRLIANTLDRTLGGLPGPGSAQALTAVANLLQNFDSRRGAGLSGIDFFQLDGVDDPYDRRDILILESLGDALERLAGPEFTGAFGGSRNQDDYRWGRLHRITFEHLLGGTFNTPPAGGAFPQPLPPLAGIPTDGGFEVVDASGHPARASGLDEFNFSAGPTRRFVAELGPWPGSVRAESSLPGGESGVPGDPRNVNLLGRWLSNDGYPLRLRIREILKDFEHAALFTP